MRILVLYSSVGAGHTRAAEALKKAFALEHKEAIIETKDILDYTPAIFRNTYAKGYLRVVRRTPELWGYIYSVSDRNQNATWKKKVRSTFNKINARSFFSFYDDFSPDITVCTHFMPLELLSTRAKRKQCSPLFCAITDFAVHSLWVVDPVDCFYVAGQMAKKQLMDHGESPEKIEITGIPIDPVFARSENTSMIHKKTGIPPGDPIVMILSGGFGVGPTLELLESFKGISTDCRLIVVTGKNEQLRQKAVKKAGTLSIPVHVFGFVDNIHELMSISTLLISKPGGLTCGEVLAKGLPMLIVNPIPGQEQRNCECLSAAGAAKQIHDISETPAVVQSLLNNPEVLVRMQEASRKSGNPDAARNIARHILNIPHR